MPVGKLVLGAICTTVLYTFGSPTWIILACCCGFGAWAFAIPDSVARDYAAFKAATKQMANLRSREETKDN